MHEKADHDGQADEFARDQRLQSIGTVIGRMREEAVQARSQSGIEQIWVSAEEANAGIDDINRHEMAGKRWLKSTVLDSGLRDRSTSDSTPKPTAFFRLTSRYVDAGAAKIGEITLPVDGKSFSLRADPVPQAVELQDDGTQFVHDGQPQMRPSTPDDAPPGQPGQEAPPAEVPLTVKDLAAHAIAKAEKSAELAEMRIHGWLTNCQHSRTMRKVIYDSALYGTGVLKGPVPDSVRTNVLTESDTPGGSPTLEMVYKTVPVTRHVPVWNFYPDPACGEDIHDGDHVFEVDHITHGKLERLKTSGFYLNDAIDLVLKQGPGKANESAANNRQTKTTDISISRFEIWYFYGQIKFDDFAAINPDDAKALQSEGHTADSVYAVVTMVNDTVIRGTLNPLEKSGEFPYHVVCWRPRARYWAGVGVGEQVDSPQRLVNAGIRAAITNGAMSSGPLIIMDDDILRPMDGKSGLTPYKIYGKQPDQAMEDARKAFAVFQIPNQTDQLLKLVEFAMRSAEESTNIPLITQGQSGKTTPDTFSGAQLQDNNANQLLRDVGYAVADGITNPLVRQMYEWLLLDPEVPSEEKGNHHVDANGAVAMVEKALQDRAVQILWPLAQDPETGFDKFAFGKAAIRSMRLHPADWQLTDEEMAKRKSTPPPPPLPLEVAKVRAESAEKIAQGRDQLASERNAKDIDRDTAYNDSLATRDRANSQLKLEELRLKVRLAELEHATQERISLQQSKVELATTTMKLATTKELAGLKTDPASHDSPTQNPVITPPIEPAGRAAEGRSYEQ